jgi:ArsR family transcriptional regulator, arsenate/arsenite/antimonite-responsive transcriptional repressor
MATPAWLFLPLPRTGNKGYIDLFRCRGRMGAMPKVLTLLEPVPSAAECCGPLTEAALTAEQAEDLAVRLKALADPTRLRIVSMLLASEGMEACTCDMTEPLGLSQPTITHHIKKLVMSGLVTGERRGTWHYYRVVPEALADLAGVIAPAAMCAS